MVAPSHSPQIVRGRDPHRVDPVEPVAAARDRPDDLVDVDRLRASRRAFAPASGSSPAPRPVDDSLGLVFILRHSSPSPWPRGEQCPASGPQDVVASTGADPKMLLRPVITLL